MVNKMTKETNKEKSSLKIYTEHLTEMASKTEQYDSYTKESKKAEDYNVSILGQIEVMKNKAKSVTGLPKKAMLKDIKVLEATFKDNGLYQRRMIEEKNKLGKVINRNNAVRAIIDNVEDNFLGYIYASSRDMVDIKLAVYNKKANQPAHVRCYMVAGILEKV